MIPAAPISSQYTRGSLSEVMLVVMGSPLKASVVVEGMSVVRVPAGVTS